jgi:hypothetical protein
MAEIKKAQVDKARAAQNSDGSQQNEWLLHGLNTIYLDGKLLAKGATRKLMVLIQV